MDDTLHSRPVPQRPETGLLAWQATIGYICTEHSPDAMLTLRAVPQGASLVWGASVSWAQIMEHVEGQTSLPAALRELWAQIDHDYRIFKTVEAAAKRPANYRDEEWLDGETRATLERMIEVTAIAFGNDWQFLVMYQPIATANARVQARLLAKESTVHVSGRGATVRHACRDLYQNAAPDYFASRTDSILS